MTRLNVWQSMVSVEIKASSEESVGVLMNSSGPGVSPAAVFLASN
jgi:hypothetical protein